MTTATFDAWLGPRNDAVLTVRGDLDPVAVRRVATFIWALLDVGADQMILDVSGVPVVPAGVKAMLAPLSAQLRDRGGWLLVTGAPELDEHGVTPLLDAFAAYRQVVSESEGVV